MARTKFTMRKSAPHHHNRVSLGAGSNGAVVQLAASRKRKPEEEMESNESSSSNESESDDSTWTVPRTDEDKINAIITKRLLSKDVEVIKEAMKSLGTMTSSKINDNFAENRKLAACRGAPIIIVLAMRRNGNSSKIQRNGIGVLVNICCSTIGNSTTRTAPDIIAVGGLKCCIWAMGRHLINTSVQVNGCLLLNNLWKRPELRKSVVDEEGIKAVVNALDNHKQNQRVQRSGCKALKALLGKESSWSQTVVDAGCIGLIIAAMNNNPNDAELQESGCKFLSRLSLAHEDYRTMVLQAKGLGPVGEALRIHNGNHKVKLVAQEALKAISA